MDNTQDTVTNNIIAAEDKTQDIILKSNKDTDRTKAIKQINEEGKTKLVMKGGLSEIFQRTLAILYDKKANHGISSSLENLDNGKMNKAVLTLVKGAIAEEDIELIVKMIQTEETQNIVVLLIEPEEALIDKTSESRYAIIESLAKKNNIMVYTSLSELIEDSNKDIGNTEITTEDEPVSEQGLEVQQETSEEPQEVEEQTEVNDSDTKSNSDEITDQLP